MPMGPQPKYTRAPAPPSILQPVGKGPPGVYSGGTRATTSSNSSGVLSSSVAKGGGSKPSGNPY